MLDDQSIALRLLQRDESALEEIYDRYGRLVFSFAVRVLRDEAEAESVVQDVFLNVWNKPQRFNPDRGPLRIWLLVVTRNAAIDRLRRKPREVPVETSDLPGGSADTTTLGELLKGERSERLRRALAEIPCEQRDVLLLSFFDDLSHTKIAETLDLPLGTVKTRIRLALKKLREAMEPMRQ